MLIRQYEKQSWHGKSNFSTTIKNWLKGVVNMSLILQGAIFKVSKHKKLAKLTKS